MPKSQSTSKQQPHSNHGAKSDETLQQLEKKVAELADQLVRAQESEKRAQADYQNLVRRSREERSQLISFAEAELIGDLLEPLEHLEMAAEQLNDSGLRMVVTQLWQALSRHGLEKIDVMDQPYDLESMEAVEIDQSVSESDARVIKVVKSGFRLNGKVIQHAKVVLG